jgi:hypothetical protein
MAFRFILLTACWLMPSSWAISASVHSSQYSLFITCRSRSLNRSNAQKNQAAPPFLLQALCGYFLANFRTFVALSYLSLIGSLCKMPAVKSEVSPLPPMEIPKGCQHLPENEDF